VLARGIASQGHQAVHVIDLGLEAKDDGVVWEYARKTQAVILTKDENFGG
jgi:predicted nuclease of predicted toxin-antitoxin system